MQGIFISYRRQDSQSAAGRLADHVKENMPGVPVFRDVETIEPGVDFTDAINRALQSCGVLLAVIGPNWVSLTDAAGRRRLDNSNDYTRLEIATALTRAGVRVIPVLVEGAQMPEPGDLPDDLQALCRRNAIELTDKRWNFDVSQLIEALRKALDIQPPEPEPHPHPRPTPPTPPAWYQRLSKKQWAGIAAVVVVLAILGEQESGTMNPDPMGLALPVNPYGQPSPMPSGLVNPVNIPPATRPSLTGNWQDEEGGRYRVIQQGASFQVEGNSPDGQVVGSGMMDNNTIRLAYSLNGVRYDAMLEISADGNQLQGGYGSAVTGEAGPLALQRIP